jgi:hypothetical protein
MSLVREITPIGLPDYPALQQLARALWRNGSTRGAAVLVGAGFSRNAILAGEDSVKPPLWFDLLHAMASELYPDALDAAPTGALRIAEEYRTYFGQAALDDFIRVRFPDTAWSPGPLHTTLLSLPWSDILTTNWDTLLERASSESWDHTYDIIRTESDLPHARSPRIVKLHGTIGDPGPLIFAEEDYRTYPTKHAAFVNLARQIFVENELCLLGFSGDDPNFLEWVGWVRDQLGGKARRIYLVGALGLRPAKRKFLESLNIAPIDFAPLLGSMNAAQRHETASKLFFEALAQAKPRPPHHWHRLPSSEYPLSQSGPGVPDLYQRVRKDDDFAAEILAQVAKIAEADRMSYPGWLVCPSEIRRVIQHVPDEAWCLRAGVLGKFGVNQRAKILFEFVWRRKTAFHPLGQELLGFLTEILEDGAGLLDKGLRREFIVALIRDTRLTHEAPTYDDLRSLEERFGREDEELGLEITYQRCLLARDKMDLQLLLDELAQLRSDTPMWKLRQAALWAEVGHHHHASKLIMEANDDLDKSHRLDRTSLWIKSRLGWANWLCQIKNLAKVSKSSTDARNRDFKELKIDPSDEIDYFHTSVREIQAARHESPEIMPLFNLGHYRESSRADRGEVDESAALKRYELDQLTEVVGIPTRLNNVDLVATAITNIAKVTYAKTFDWYVFLIRGLHSHYDKPFEKYFNRIAIAQLSNDAAQQLILIVREGISFWIKRRDESHGQREDRGFSTDRLRLLIMVLSRLTVRMKEEEASEAFAFALKLAADQNLCHHWLLEAIGDLVRQAANAIPSNRRGDLALASLSFPLSSEKGIEPRFWPNPAAWLWNCKPHRAQDDTAWALRISQLVAATRENQKSREEASLRLTYLALEGSLSESELASFGEALWSITGDGEHALPVGTNLLDSTFAELPGKEGIDPAARVRHQLFEADLGLILSPAPPISSIDLGVNRSIMHSMRNAYKLGIKPEAKKAQEYFDLVTCWEPPKADDIEPFTSLVQYRRDIEALAGDLIGQVFLPELAVTELTEQRRERLLEFVFRSHSWSGLSGAPYFLAAHPDKEEAVAKVIEKGIASSVHSRVANAVMALLTWVDVATTRGIPPLPNSVTKKLIHLIDAKHEQGLHALLHAASVLQRAKKLDPDNQTALIAALSDLFEDTKYDAVDIETRKAVSISLVRAQCVRLATTLRDAGHSDSVLLDWAREAELDPLPEVRFSLHGDDLMED